MNPESSSENQHSGGSKPDLLSTDTGRTDSNSSDCLNHCYVSRVRPSEANGFAVYTRNKRFKSRSVGVIECWDKEQDNFGNLTEAEGGLRSSRIGVLEGSNVDNVNGVEGNLGISGSTDGSGWCQRQKAGLEVEEDLLAAVVGRNHEYRSSTENQNCGDLQETVGVDGDHQGGDRTMALGSPRTGKMEMKMSKKILVKGRPTTVRELFETGLLEGYPVFYNGGKRGIPLRGTIKGSGILCSCSLCEGARVVPPCQFEIHACKAYRRASQYICLGNGKSLLDVVKECRRSSAKTLEETIQNYVGPMPVKESITCRHCKGPFLATSASKMELLCDSCMIILNSEVDADCVKSRPLQPLLGLTQLENSQLLSSSLKKERRGRKKRKHLELSTGTKSPVSSSLQISSTKKGRRRITNMLYPPHGQKLHENDHASLHASLKKKTTRKTLKKLALADTSSPKSSNVGSPSGSVQSKNSFKITKKDQMMHKLVFENDGLPDGAEVAYYSHGKKLREGYKLGSGIICRCCSTLVSPSIFEAHSGWAARHKPYMYIYTSNGVSLHELAISLLKGFNRSSKKSDNLCIICADGGKLVFCNGCPRAFHKECASLSSTPLGNWNCTYCRKRDKLVEWNANAVAAASERALSNDSLEQITDQRISTVKCPEEAEIIACVICRGYDFCKSGFGPRTVILCDQCEKEYHVGCLKKRRMADLKELPKGKWFCSSDCRQIHSSLKLVLNSRQELPDSSLDIIRNKLVENSAETYFDIRWKLLNGKNASRETRTLLSQAVAIFHDCFSPIIDPETQRDFITSMVYGRNIRGQDYSGMYCAILTMNSTVVSAGILRIFGQEIAELPLVATHRSSRCKGFCQALYSSIESLLAYLKVKTLVLPAMANAKSLWTDKLGFQEIPEEKLINYRRNCWQMMSFDGTTMLEKAVPDYHITQV